MAIRVIAAMVALLALPTGGQAKQITQMRLGNWDGGAYTNDATGAFSHCVVSAPYQSGITMFISVGRDYEWSLGFAKANWSLRKGDRYPLIYKIDDSGWKNAQAVAILPTVVKVPMPANSELVNLFRRGRRMDLVAAGENFSFNLTGTSAAVAALASCVGGQLTLESNAPGPSNPFAARGSAKAAPAIASTEEATRIATNFLLAANLPAARLLSREEEPEGLRKHGAVWSWRSGIGTVDIGSGTPEQNIAHLIAEDAAACKSKFASGSAPPDSNQGAVVYQAFTVCGTAPEVLTQYFVMRRAAGGVYGFAIGETLPANAGKAAPEAVDIPSIRKAVFSSTHE